MRIGDVLSISLRDLSRHPLRAVLASLGMAVGIATLVAVAAGEHSWRQALEGWYEMKGVDVLQVYRFWRPIANLPGNKNETVDLLAHCPSITNATPVAEGSRGRSHLPVTNARHDWCGVRGVLPGFERVFGTRLLRGRFLTEEDERTRANVCILDAEASRELFGSTDMLGKQIRVGGHRLRVVGISERLSFGGLAYMMGIMGDAYAADVERIERLSSGLVIPLSTARRTLGLPVTRLCARSADHPATIGELGRYLSLDPNATGERQWVVSLAPEKAAALLARRKMQLLLGTAASLILMSCGVALASVMYVAVSERQREIGVLRAHGASAGAIRRTFVFEGLWLGLIGGIGGLALGLPAAGYLSGVSFPHELSGAGRNPVMLATSVLPGMQQSVEWRALAVAAAAMWVVAMVAASLPAGAATQLRPSEAIASAPRTRHRLRRALTGLQLCVGVAAVLLLTSLHEGVALEVLGEIVRFSQADTVWVTLRQTRSRDEMQAVAGPFYALALDPREVEALERECSEFRSLDTAYLITPLSAKRGRYHEQIAASAVTEGFFEAEGMELVEGRFPTSEEMHGGDRVIVLTDRTAGSLGLETAVGETVRLDGLPFRIVGVVTRGAEIASEYAYIPVTSVAKSWAGLLYGGVSFRSHLRSAGRYRAAERQILAALARRLPESTMRHVQLRGNAADRARLTGLRRSGATRASAIGFSALLIAVIGLVNMLLVSVSEQTREIGLRRACGASRPAIAGMVLLEALVICLPGCVAGLGLGIVASKYVGGWAHLSTAVPAFWVMVSAGTALLGGLLASLIPAVRAALLHPVEALRHE